MAEKNPVPRRGSAITPENMTPLQKQYYEIKSQNADCLLLFRLGDFYELFGDDAYTASEALGLMLTTRDRGKPAEEQMPMCGVPYHSADSYIAELLKKGFKVAICEQMEDPATAKGLVKREVTRIITPGTVTDESMLEQGRSNYVCAVYADRQGGGAAFCDLSTGEFCVRDIPGRDAAEHLCADLGSFAPSEVLLPDGALKDAVLSGFLRERLRCSVEAREPEYFDLDLARERLCRQFGGTVEQHGLNARSPAVRAAGALLRYLDETQKRPLDHINTLQTIDSGRYMELDWATRRSLELTESLQKGEKRGSLLWVLDHTRTPMGARTLRSWVEMPLLSPAAIRRRLAAVGDLVGDSVRRGELSAAMSGMGDMQRAASRAAYQAANGRDLNALAEACGRLPEIKRLLDGVKSRWLCELAGLDTLDDVLSEIRSAIADEPPLSIHDGDIIRPGFSSEVDHLRSVRDNAAQLIAGLEARERERTGVRKLKIGYNRVFGYYIDVPGSVDASSLPDEYVRKQTLANHERYFTVELKSLEAEISTARERVCRLEYCLFCETRAKIAKQVDRIQAAAEAVAELDALCSLAETAVRNGYVCPDVDDSGVIDIRDGRHPVVELMQKDARFVPNDTFLNRGDDRLAIITGPNMAGKSTYMRQTALIVLMAQMGSYVPAKSATIGIVDRVFTRIGASDDLSGGRSTFMMEMSEVAEILKNATRDSLILLDEIGRGTSTYDGMAIARAVLEYCAGKRTLGAKTLLATHYHELTELEGRVDGVRNYSITARKQGKGVIFLRKIVPGAADESYGIEVAALAGVPDEVVSYARACLDELTAAAAHTAAYEAPAETDDVQLDFGDTAGEEVLDELRNAKLDTMSPIEAMNLLYALKRKLAP